MDPGTRTPIRVHNTMERRLHAHTRKKNSQTPKKLRKNTRKPLPCKYYLLTTLDTYKQRHTPQRFTHFYISHSCSLSHRKPNAPSLGTRTHSKTLEADPAENKKFRKIRRRIRRRCQTNQSHINHPHPPQHIRYHTCNHSFLPTPRLTNLKDPHPATYKSIHAIDITPNLA